MPERLHCLVDPLEAMMCVSEATYGRWADAHCD